MKSTLTKISKIKCNPNNPRVIKDHKFANLVQSIKDFPQMLDIRPIVVNNYGVVLGGNMRLKACRDAGLKEVPVINAKDLTEEQQREFIIKDNVESGEWDWDLLANEWDADLLEEWGVDFNFDLPEDDNEGLTDEDAVPDVTEKPVSKMGDIWLLGDHRVMCGDSTSADNVALLMNGEKADMVFTDPPYGMFLDADYSAMKNNLDFAKAKEFTGGKKYDNVIGDHEDFNPDVIKNIFNCFDYCREIFLWGADYYSEYLVDKNNGSWIVWDKRANNNDNVEADESSDKMYGSCFELCWSRNRHKRDIARVKWASVFGTEQEFDRKRHHPTQKPALLAEWFFDRWGSADNLVVDIYLGSGSTLIASEKKNRKCYGMELDPTYVDVIIKRWQEYTGKKAIHADSGQEFKTV
jgi:DNA modification methylase